MATSTKRKQDKRIKPEITKTLRTVLPKEQWQRNRLQELEAAIEDHALSWRKIPDEWISEYNELIRLFK